MTRSENAKTSAGTEALKIHKQSKHAAPEHVRQPYDRPGGFREAIQRALANNATPAERESFQALRGIAIHTVIWNAGDPVAIREVFEWLDSESARRYGGGVDLMLQLAGDLEAWLAVEPAWIDPDLPVAAGKLNRELERLIRRWRRTGQP